MPTLIDLLKIEGSIEAAGCAILTLTAKAVSQFSDKKRAQPGYEVKVSDVKETRGLYFHIDGIKYPAEWKGMFRVRSVTKRYETSDEQPALTAAVRLMRFQYPTLFSEANLPFHYLTWMEESGGARQHTEDKFDLTDQDFDIIVRIRPQFIPKEV